MMKFFRLSLLCVVLINIIILPVKIGFAMDAVRQLNSLQEQTSRQREQALRRQSVQERQQQQRQLNSKIKAETDNAKASANEAKIAEKEFKTDLKRVKKLKNQEKYGKVSEAVAPFSKPLSRQLLRKSIHASGSYPAALKKAVESGDKAYDKHKTTSDYEKKAVNLLNIRAAQYPPGHPDELYMGGQSLRHENEAKIHLEKALKINNQTIKLSEEHKALKKKLGSPPEYLPPSVHEKGKDLNDGPPSPSYDSPPAYVP
ncbi:MAG: hypothetical protein ABIQ95_05400 [Bdellovibrionia bacterium]